MSLTDAARRAGPPEADTPSCCEVFSSAADISGRDFQFQTELVGNRIVTTVFRDDVLILRTEGPPLRPGTPAGRLRDLVSARHAEVQSRFGRGPAAANAEDDIRREYSPLDQPMNAALAALAALPGFVGAGFAFQRPADGGAPRPIVVLGEAGRLSDAVLAAAFAAGELLDAGLSDIVHLPLPQAEILVCRFCEIAEAGPAGWNPARGHLIAAFAPQTRVEHCREAMLSAACAGHEPGSRLRPPGAPQPGEEAPVAELERESLKIVREERLEVPQAPATLAEAIRVANDPQASLAAIRRLVERDQALAAAVLQHANSSMFCGMHRIGTINEAVVRLGQRNVRTVLFTVFMETRVFRCSAYAPFVGDVWKHSAACARTARILAAALGKDPELAFMGGLLHDVGKAVLVTTLAGRAQGGRLPSSGAVSRAVAKVHCLAGLIAAHRWGLPEALANLIGMHHGYQRAPADKEMVAIVQTADAYVNLHAIGRAGAEGVSPVDAETLDRASGGAAAFAGVTADVVRRLEEALPALREGLENPFRDARPDPRPLTDADRWRFPAPHPAPAPKPAAGRWLIAGAMTLAAFSALAALWWLRGC